MVKQAKQNDEGGCKDSKQIRTNYAQVFRESRAVAPQGARGVLGFQV